MKQILNIIQNRNVILISALILAFIFPKNAIHLKEYTIFILAIVMTFSTTGIKFKMLADIKSLLNVTFQSILMNYIIHGSIILILAYFIFDETKML